MLLSVGHSNIFGGSRWSGDLKGHTDRRSCQVQLRRLWIWGGADLGHASITLTPASVHAPVCLPPCILPSSLSFPPQDLGMYHCICKSSHLSPTRTPVPSGLLTLVQISSHQLTETSSRKTLDCPQASGPAALPSVSHKFNFSCTVECQGPCTLECKLRER